MTSLPTRRSAILCSGMALVATALRAQPAPPLSIIPPPPPQWFQPTPMGVELHATLFGYEARDLTVEARTERLFLVGGPRGEPARVGELIYGATSTVSPLPGAINTGFAPIAIDWTQENDLFLLGRTPSGDWIIRQGHVYNEHVRDYSLPASVAVALAPADLASGGSVTHQVYIADNGSSPGVVVYDLDTKSGWRVQGESSSGLGISSSPETPTRLAFNGEGLVWSGEAFNLYELSAAALSIPEMAARAVRFVRRRPTGPLTITAAAGFYGRTYAIDKKGGVWTAAAGQTPLKLMDDIRLRGVTALAVGHSGLYALAPLSQKPGTCIWRIGAM